jgi:hypothetical protein
MLLRAIQKKYSPERQQEYFDVIYSTVLVR